MNPRQIENCRNRANQVIVRHYIVVGETNRKAALWFWLSRPIIVRPRP